VSSLRLLSFVIPIRVRAEIREITMITSISVNPFILIQIGGKLVNRHHY
jgi:hypothetical protein